MTDPGGDRDEQARSRGRVKQVLEEERGQPGAVAEKLPAQRIQIGPVTVPDQRRRLIGDGVSGQQQADEDVEVLAAGRRGARAEGLVEAAERAQHLAAKGHVRAGTERPRAVRVQRARPSGPIEVEQRWPAARRP